MSELLDSRVLRLQADQEEALADRIDLDTEDRHAAVDEEAYRAAEMAIRCCRLRAAALRGLADEAEEREQRL